MRRHGRNHKIGQQDFSESILELFNLTTRIFGFEILLNGCKQQAKNAGYLSKAMRITSQAKLKGKKVAKKKKSLETYCVITSVWVEFVVHCFNNSSSE